MTATWGIINYLIGEKTQKLPSENFTLNRTITKPEDTVDTFNSDFVTKPRSQFGK